MLNSSELVMELMETGRVEKSSGNARWVHSMAGQPVAQDSLEVGQGPEVLWGVLTGQRKRVPLFFPVLGSTNREESPTRGSTEDSGRKGETLKDGSGKVCLCRHIGSRHEGGWAEPQEVHVCLGVCVDT